MNPPGGWPVVGMPSRPGQSGAGSPDLRLGLTLYAASKPQLLRLSHLLAACPQLRVGPRLLVGLADPVVPPVTPLGVLDSAGLAPEVLITVLSRLALLGQPRPYLLALVDQHDLLGQRLLQAAPLVVGAIAPTTVGHEQASAALRFLAAPVVAGSSQLWFDGLRPPSAPLLARRHADLQLLAMLLKSDKLAAAAEGCGYTRRGLQAQVAGLCQRLELTRSPGRCSPAALVAQILNALRRVPVAG